MRGCQAPGEGSERLARSLARAIPALAVLVPLECRHMHRYLALLRGVNVGGKLVAMDDLRAIATAIGFADATTYIRSGNLLFSCAEADTAALADRLERGITDRLGIRSAVVVLAGPELKQVIA